VQLLSPRLRILFMIIIWLVAIVALILWLGGSRLMRVTVAGGPAGSETLALTYAIADALNEAQPGFKMIVLESGGSGENL